MFSPLPRYQRPPAPIVDDAGVSYADYLRRIDFCDAAPREPNEAPVHVLCRTLFDGVMPPCRIAKDGLTVDLSALDATVVTMHVHPEDVDVEKRLIGGRHVLTPMSHGFEWVPVDEGDPESFIVVSILVAEVHVQ